MSAAQGLLAYDPNAVKPGWIAFFLVLALVIATFLLWRSMNTQLGRIQVPSHRPPDTRIPGASDTAGEPAALAAGTPLLRHAAHP